LKVGAGSTARPNCLGCAHYFITYDASFPYGCKLLGIKSRRQPMLEVIEATGKPCHGFEPSPRKAIKRESPDR
jgi:hypothetical protein